ncbi:MAG: hypothetical protein AAGA03_15815, partial [Planctomycetota bacterium]
MTPEFPPSPLAALTGRSSGEEASPTGGVIQASATSVVDSTKTTSSRLVGTLTGKPFQDRQRGKQLYQGAHAKFVEAKSREGDAAKDLFSDAAKQFGRAGMQAPGSALQQDAMFMQAESYFFADQLTDARDAYELLQKEFPRNRHADAVAARLFSIGRYWIDVAKVDESSWFSLNFFDSKRPMLDADGNAIRVLDQIRYDNPTGRLADDATMAAAAEYIRQRKFQ